MYKKYSKRIVSEKERVSFKIHISKNKYYNYNNHIHNACAVLISYEKLDSK